MIDKDGTVLLADFGVAATMERGGTWGNQQMSRNTFVGTPCWMAPEVMEQTEGYVAYTPLQQVSTLPTCIACITERVPGYCISSVALVLFTCNSQHAMPSFNTNGVLQQ